MGYLNPDSSMDCRRIVATDTKSVENNNQIVTGQIVDVSQSQSSSIFVLIPFQNKNGQYQIKIDSKTEFTDSDENKIKSSKTITKKDLKLSYYAKYIDLDDNNSKITFNINNQKIIEDEKLDGIKGFVTNDFTLTANEIIEHYNNQYEVERAFRISKTDLKIRPIYHRLETRIKAHILISFVSYAIYKEFERKLKINDVKFNFSQKLLRKIIEHLIALKIDDEIIPINPSEIQKQILDIL